ncbi:uncharacterized protein LOC125665275 [Ostrea edulis]|uniref:uncharacterized protein LOC125665275 n=1 Tax=Ostrea edulis TaxID=37623 RepID=UPI0024AF5D09|nr:uncharacterized protein LOC125665275 [Ostrea edulis]
MLEKADVVPVPKVTPVCNPMKDLRPISLTSVLAKLLEKHPVQHLRESCPNVDPSQLGATRGSSTTHALLKILQPIYKALNDSNNFARLLSIDFSKAFDHIYHEKDWVKINGGVPQGTLRDPELFMHMVADLQTEVHNVKFVDDTTFIEILRKDAHSKMTSTVKSTLEWSSENQLGINTFKTKEMIISFEREPDIDKLNMNGTEIERVSVTKLLGVVISENLKWGLHVKYI